MNTYTVKDGKEVELEDERVTGTFTLDGTTITLIAEMLVTISGGKITASFGGEEMTATREGNSNTFVYTKTGEDGDGGVVVYTERTTFNADGSITAESSKTHNGKTEPTDPETIPNLTYEGDPSHDGVIKLKDTQKGTLKDEGKTLMQSAKRSGH